VLNATDAAVDERRSFHIFTVGWELALIRALTTPVAERTGIRFTHGLVGDGRRLPDVRRDFPGIEFLALSKANGDALPRPDHEFLASIESVGVPTIRGMIQGDRVLRYRPESESLGYATLLAHRIRAALDEFQPDVVLGSFDGLHAALSLAVAKSRGIPWVAMAFTVIPDNLTGFCKGVTPDTLIRITREDLEALRPQAEEIMWAVRSKRQKIMAYRSPASLGQRARQLVEHGRNLGRRVVAAKDLGVDRFTYPTASERCADIVRRSLNHLRLPAGRMLTAPPEGRFAFFPLQMAPESSIDTWAPFYQDQLALVAQLSLALPADLEFVVKIHFSDHDNYSPSELRRLMQLPRLRIARPNASSHAFLERSTLVAAIQGTASLEAALLGKPVLLFGASPYQDFPGTQRAERPDALPGQIRRMLEIPPPSDAEIVEAFVAYLARYMPGRVNDWSRPIEPVELGQLADCFQALRSYVEVPSNRSDWYAEPPFAARREVL
jgi:hypothetical protein